MWVLVHEAIKEDLHTLLPAHSIENIAHVRINWYLLSQIVQNSQNGDPYS